MSIAPTLLRRARADAALTQAELARRAGTSQSAVAAYEAGTKTPSADTLDRLLRAAGVRIETSPLLRSPWGELRIGELIRRRSDEIRRTASTFGASNVRVFGSVARGEDDPGSDLDFLVDMEPGRSLLDQVRLRRALEKLLGVDVDVVTSGGLLDRDVSILNESIPV